MQSTPVFLDIKKFGNLQRKKADVSRNKKGVCPVVYIFFEPSLGKV